MRSPMLRCSFIYCPSKVISEHPFYIDNLGINISSRYALEKGEVLLSTFRKRAVENTSNP